LFTLRTGFDKLRANEKILNSTVLSLGERSPSYGPEQSPGNQAMAQAYLSGQHAMLAVAAYFGVDYTTVSGIVSNHE